MFSVHPIERSSSNELYIRNSVQCSRCSGMSMVRPDQWIYFSHPDTTDQFQMLLSDSVAMLCDIMGAEGSSNYNPFLTRDPNGRAGQTVLVLDMKRLIDTLYRHQDALRSSIASGMMLKYISLEG